MEPVAWSKFEERLSLVEESVSYIRSTVRRQNDHITEMC